LDYKNAEELGEEYERCTRIESEAQKWLDSHYPKKKKSEVVELNIFNKNLEGPLDLSDFVNLEELNCSRNKITSLDIRKCSNLVFLSC